ncbi:relaxase/mobilization nuclease domain-containing protein [Mariniphaga sediminis]|uniref:relaxase/mobilization nuclease domain-containing protein n=1 Tax=Mariniphaga sediminis TaxID=1628158 RepID=UPI003566AC39
MVIVIHQATHTENALRYNEKKVKEGKAVFFHSRNTLSVNPFMYDEKHRLKNLLDIEKANTRVKNKCLHISFNPSAEDYRKLGEQTIRNEIDRMMEHMGYANQPYFVYKHQDLDRVHFHVVSTRIDRQTGRKIKDNYEKQKMQKFVQELEQKYQLSNKQTKEQPDFKFSPRSRNIKQNLENLFAHLNRMPEINSKEMYNEALKLFNVEIKKSGRGHIVLVTDGEGNPIRYPIRLSKFKERPRFYVSAKVEQTVEISTPVIDKFQLAQWARDLNRVVERSKIKNSKPISKFKLKKKSRPKRF